MGMKISYKNDKIYIELMNSSSFLNFSGEDFSKHFKCLFSEALQNNQKEILITNNTKSAKQGLTTFCTQYTFYNTNKEFFNDIGVNYNNKSSRKNFNGRLNLSLYVLSELIENSNSQYNLEKLKKNSENYQKFKKEFNNFLDEALPKSKKINKNNFIKALNKILSLDIKTMEFKENSKLFLKNIKSISNYDLNKQK
jgi:hypothetical protein